jgi:prepilin-type N-terminal cleavage/methylation domain-containing protein
MRTPTRLLPGREGFALVELLVAMVILVIGVLGTLALIDRANATTVSTRGREAAVNVTRELAEAARSVPYASLTPASIEGEIQSLPALGDDGAPAGWTIRRRGYTFTVNASMCTFDDPRDKGGTHAAGNFCADSATGTEDRNPEDYRRVRVDVHWNDRGTAREAHQTLLINNPGSAGAPAVRTLDINAGSATRSLTGQVTAAASDTLVFDLTTSSKPATLHWLLDGGSQAPITNGAGQSWHFNWSLGSAETGVVDGAYVVSAEAFDEYGVSGPSRSLTVSLNRVPPSQVTAVAGGRTGDPAQRDQQVVDLEWLPNPERDIVGYSVERTDNAGTIVEVCARKDQTSCIDQDPPVEDGLIYRVYAWDTWPDSGQPRKGTAPSDPLVVKLDNNPPFAPASATATLQGDGSVSLSWPRPSPEDPDTGDGIAFYRIYRDGTTYGARYATWIDADATAQFIDGNTGGTPHDYWITAVDNNYAESTPVKAVAG